MYRFFSPPTMRVSNNDTNYQTAQITATYKYSLSQDALKKLQVQVVDHANAHAVMCLQSAHLVQVTLLSRPVCRQYSQHRLSQYRQPCTERASLTSPQARKQIQWVPRFKPGGGDTPKTAALNRKPPYHGLRRGLL